MFLEPKKCMIHKWKILHNSLNDKVKKNKINEKKYKIHDFKNKIKMKKQLIIIFMLISSSISLCVFYFFRNEGKSVALPVYSSFRRVATNGIRSSSVATSSIN